MNVNDFGKWLRKNREERDLTVRALAKYSGVSSAYISQIENGERGTPSAKILRKLAKPLKLNLSEIYKAAGVFVSSDFSTTKNVPEHVQAAHKKIEIPISEDDLDVVEKFLKVARERFKKEKG